MKEPLTVYGELTTVPWALGRTLRIVTVGADALFWESSGSPEDFLVFLRTVFPNGGYFFPNKCNNSVIWSPVDGDAFAIGFRRLRQRSSCIVAVLECPEEYPGASASPDRELSLKSCRFLVEEFLRGTDPVAIHKCTDTAIVLENSSWWEYVQKLEKVVHWKYPEAKFYREFLARNDPPRRDRSRSPILRPSDKWTNRSDEARKRRTEDWDYRDKRSKDYSRTNNDAGTRSWTSEYHTASERQRNSKQHWSLNVRNGTKSAKEDHGESETDVGRDRLRGLNRCEECNIEFAHSYEHIQHLNSAEHLKALEKRIGASLL